MSVPIAVVGKIPKIRISSGVISQPPPMPVIPTSTPMPNPKRTIAGSISGSGAPHQPPDLDFPDLLGQKCGVRQDTKDGSRNRRGVACLRQPTNARLARFGARAERRGRARGPFRMRQVDAARADLRAAGTEGGDDQRWRPNRGQAAARPLRLHAPAGSAAPLVLGDRQCGAGAAQPRDGAARGARRRRRPLRALRPRGLRSGAAGRRPRRRRNRPRLRRRPRGGNAGAPRRKSWFLKDTMRPKGTTRWDGIWRWLLPVLFLAALIGLWQLAASTGLLASVLDLED